MLDQAVLARRAARAWVGAGRSGAGVRRGPRALGNGRADRATVAARVRWRGCTPRLGRPGSGEGAVVRLVPSGPTVQVRPWGLVQVVGAVAGALVGPAGEGLGSVMSSAQGGEVLWVGLAGWSALVGRDVGDDVVEVAGPGVACRTRGRRSAGRGGSPVRASTVAGRAGRRRRCGSGRGPGGSWLSSPASQDLMRSRVAGPSFSTSPTTWSPAAWVARSASETCT